MITFKELYRVIFRDLQRITKNYRIIFRITFRDLHENIQRNTQKITFKKIFRETFRDLHNFRIFRVQERNCQCLYNKILKNFEGQKTLSNNKQRKSVTEREYQMKNFLFIYTFVLFVLQQAANLPFALKIVVSYMIKEFPKLNPFQN